jgi:hypothetical protein
VLTENPVMHDGTERGRGRPRRRLPRRESQRRRRAAASA